MGRRQTSDPEPDCEPAPARSVPALTETIEALFDHTLVSAVLLDRNLDVLHANPAFGRRNGLRPGDIAGRRFPDIMPDLAMRQALDEVTRTGQPATVATRSLCRGAGRLSEDGRWTWSLAPILDEAEGLKYLFLLGVDVTNQEAPQDGSGAMEHIYRTVFDCMSEGVVFQSADGTIMAANPAAERLLGLPAGDMLGRDSHAPEWGPVREDGSAFPGEQHPAMATLRTGKPEIDVVMGVRRPDGTRSWISINSRPVTHPHEARPYAVVTTFHDITERKAAEERQILMLHELNHRVKNTLAVVQSMAIQTLKTSPDPEAFTEAFNSRLLSLSNSHELLTRNDWTGAQLRELIAEQVRPYDIGGDRFRLDGPDVRLRPKAALALSLALSELATNAAKYGALSVDGGTVGLTWAREPGADGPEVRLTWRERGGPVVRAPTRHGLGVRLIERTLPHELGGSARILYDPGGLTCEIAFPLRGNAS